MAPPESIHSVNIDPFAAIYKSGPGRELPLFCAKEKDQEGKEEGREKPQASIENSKNHDDLYQVFSPTLAGERDRVIRKRILSNPDNFLPLFQRNCVSGNNSSKKQHHAPDLSLNYLSDRDDNLSFSDSESSTDDDDAEEEVEFEPCRHLQFRSNRLATTIQSSHFRSGIFFSESQDFQECLSGSLSKPKTGENRQNQRSSKKQLRSQNRRRFSATLSRAITRADGSIDIDHQGIHRIPNLINLLGQKKKSMGQSQSQSSARAIAMIDKILNQTPHFGARQPITRAKSVPLVSFSPLREISLCLSNNYLGSFDSKLERIGSLQGLQSLSLRSNSLKEIPDEIGRLKNLKSLNLSYNSLRFLPASILNLKEDCEFQLAGNPWFTPPSSTSQKTRDDTCPENFTWLSRENRIFHFPASPSPSVDQFQRHSILSLVGSCIRRLCITQDPVTGEEKINELNPFYQQDGLPEDLRLRGYCHPNPLPKRIEKILSKPHKHFYACDLCKKRLILRPKSLAHALNHLDDGQSQSNLCTFYQFEKLGRNQSSPNTISRHQEASEGQAKSESDDADLKNTTPIRWNACSLECCLQHLVK